MKWGYRFYIGGIDNGQENGIGYCCDLTRYFKYYGEFANTKFHGYGLLEQEDCCTENCQPTQCNCYKYKIMDIGPKEGWFEEGDFKFEIKPNNICNRCDDNNKTAWVSKAWSCICNECKVFFHDNPSQKNRRYKYWECHPILIIPNDLINDVNDPEIIHRPVSPANSPPFPLRLNQNGNDFDMIDMIDTMDEEEYLKEEAPKGFSKKTKIRKECDEAKEVVKLNLDISKQNDFSGGKFYQSLFESLLLKTKQSDIFLNRRFH